jgi:hypothetical protein
MATAAPVKLLRFYGYRFEGGKFLADNFFDYDEENAEPYEIIQILKCGATGNTYVDYIDKATGDVRRNLNYEHKPIGEREY